MGCGADGPPAPTAAAATPPEVTGLPIAADTVASDQIEYTLEQSPAAESQAAAPARVKSVAPPPPTNSTPAAPPRSATPPPAASSSNAPDHTAWNNLLRDHVSNTGRVDYRGMQTDETKLEAYLATLGKEVPDDSWSRNEALAYWINAYNAFTIKLILNNWPVASIRDLKEPWDQRWIELAGKTYSLNQIEHDIIRPTYREPRIHFALVCAAKSCPPLPNEAFTAQNLDQLLTQRTRNFINDEERNVTQEEVVRVSPLFDWYGQDFGDVKAYLNKYLVTDIPASKELSFLDYDWSLND